MTVSASERGERGHGSPYDRGEADSYYRRTPRPHYHLHFNGTSHRIPAAQMTPDQIAEYWAGYNYNETQGDWVDLNGDY